MSPFVIAAVGAGGKTTALLHLARALSHRAVLLTTTTHMFPVSPPLCRSLLLDPPPSSCRNSFAGSELPVRVRVLQTGKWGRFPLPCCSNPSALPILRFAKRTARTAYRSSCTVRMNRYSRRKPAFA